MRGEGSGRLRPVLELPCKEMGLPALSRSVSPVSPVSLQGFPGSCSGPGTVRGAIGGDQGGGGGRLLAAS